MGVPPPAQIIKNIMISTVFLSWEAREAPTTSGQTIEILVANIDKYNKIPQERQTNTTKY